MSARPNEVIDRVLEYAEATLYSLVAVLLVGGAAVLVVDSASGYVDHVGEGVRGAATELLSTLLVVFIFVELLGAVRTTIRERRLVAEPFLLVGIIASIKEIVVVAGAERPAERKFEDFRDAMIEIGVLSVIVLLLSISAVLLRRRHREPAGESP